MVGVALWALRRLRLFGYRFEKLDSTLKTSFQRPLALDSFGLCVGPVGFQGLYRDVRVYPPRVDDV